MLDQKITFDSFIRGVIVICLSAAGICLINYLSGVLLPFFVAWIMAYMLYPLVHFLQYRMRLRSRVLSIVVALCIVLGILAGFAAIIIPPVIEESDRLAKLITLYFNDIAEKINLSSYLHQIVRNFSGSNSLLKLAQQNTFIEVIQTLAIQAWELAYSTVNIAMGIFGAFVVLLYMFFILLDYEKISHGWVNLIPTGKREFAAKIVQDVKSGMNAYFRGQALIALCVGILFSTGFLIIDFPLAIGLGLFIGILNLVPYLQLLGFVPTIILAAIKAAETGQSFWFILLCALAVFAVVQLIQDLYLTPRIMGKVMGLNPAVILLSLSVWGSLLGAIGLIIALPLTTLLLSYYRLFILKEEPQEA